MKNMIILENFSLKVMAVIVHFPFSHNRTILTSHKIFGERKEANLEQKAMKAITKTKQKAPKC